MQTLHWVALVLAVIGVALIVAGVLQQRAARPSEDLVGGFAGPPGSSDVGAAEGFAAPDPHDHYPVGRLWRLSGLALVLIALGLVGYSWLA